MASGFCGESLMWWIEDGTLTISGTGNMENYSWDKDSKSANTPWWDYRNEIEKIIIHDGITSIGDYAFNRCENLIEITIPDCVTAIGKEAFLDCESLTKIKIPANVTAIGYSAFSGCVSLKEIKIPDGVTSIGKDIFGACENLIKVKIPDSVTSIGQSAFYYCSSLKEIKIPDSVTTIGSSAFSCCSNLTAIKIPDGVKKIYYLAFSNCESLTTIKIPDSVTTIGAGAFSWCFSLRKIKIPDSVMEIGEQAFFGCKSLTEIKIPYSVTEIGERAFDGCTRLEKIYCRRGTGFESILCEGNNARIIYYDDKPPAQIQPPKPVRKPKPAPEKLRWKVEGKTLTVGGVREIKFYSYGELPWVESVDAIQHIVIEEGVEKISAEAFAECTRLELLTIPASVKTIGDRAFTFCYCGDRSVNGGKNVLWSLDDGILTFKKNPAAKSDANFSLGAVSWRAVENNITGVKVERGIIPDKRFFDWLGGLGSDVPVSF